MKKTRRGLPEPFFRNSRRVGKPRTHVISTLPKHLNSSPKPRRNNAFGLWKRPITRISLSYVFLVAEHTTLVIFATTKVVCPTTLVVFTLDYVRIMIIGKKEMRHFESKHYYL